MKRIQTIPIRNCALVCLAALVTCGIGIRAAGQEEPLSTGAETPQAHLGEGYEALRQDRYEVAVKEFRAALALDPKLVLRARFPLAVALFELHQGDEARREFEEVRKEAGDHANIAYYLGRLDLDDGKFDEAVQNLEKAAVKPPFPDTAYFLGYAYSKKGELAAAKKWLNEAAKLNPRDARVPFQLGQIYRREGRGDEAKKALALSQELRQRDSTESKLRLECSQKLEVDQLDEARKVCDQLYDPDDPDRLTELGTLYGRHGDLEDALRPLRRAAEIAPQSPQVQYNLAFAYFQMNRLAEARAPLEGALKRWPDLFQLNALYGAVLFKLGETAEAYRALTHAHQLNPQDAVTANMLYLEALELAQEAVQAKQFEISVHYLKEAVELRPQDAQPHLRLAEIYDQNGDSNGAAAERRTAEELSQRISHP